MTQWQNSTSWLCNVWPMGEIKQQELFDRVAWNCVQLSWTPSVMWKKEKIATNNPNNDSVTQRTKAHLTVTCLCLYDPYHSLPIPPSTLNFRSWEEEEVISEGSISGCIWFSAFQVVQPSRGTDRRKEGGLKTFFLL